MNYQVEFAYFKGFELLQKILSCGEPYGALFKLTRGEPLGKLALKGLF